MSDHGTEQTAAIDELYALPLDEFTPARAELAKRLRREGEGDAGAEVKGLRKPSVAAWALNQVRRNNGPLTDELLAAGERLREAQERLLAGEGREPLQQAGEVERRLVGELARHAERELVAAGRQVSASVQEKLRATLHAAASDPEAREALAAGRLVRDHEATGLGPLAEGAPSAGAPTRRQGKESSTKASAALERRARQLEAKVERGKARQLELDEESDQAKSRLNDARREAARSARELERAEAAEERARERAQKAADALGELERELRELTA